MAKSKYPSVYTLENLFKSARETSCSRDGKTWVPARSLGYPSLFSRLRCAWLVFSGQADAVIWPEGQ